jgi:WS/DGAT/MGAT family acyltransferase
VEHVLVSPVEIVDGTCTGRPGGPLLWRAGKAAAVAAFAAEHDIDLGQSYAYSNGDEDVPFLRTVGRPRALNPGKGLAAAARHYSWPVARFRSRSGGGPVGLARAVAGFGGMLGGFAVGAALSTLTSGSRRDAVDMGIALGGDLSTALAGVHLDVEGAEHLATRPAVLLFNHQSQLDVLVLAKLLRGGFTGVAKKELASTPGFGWMFRFADVAFVDRTDSAQAREALRPAVERLHEGISLVIAPEGTRSATPSLGPFKKGAFHVAMQAGVPLVPIVIRNAGELMWRGSTAVQPGTVQVRVLPPVPTEGWTVEELDQRIAEVRESYRETLANWSGRPTRPVVATESPADVAAPPAAPLDWGTSPEMNAVETAMWRAEAADPRLRANVTLLELLDPAPDWERLRAAHEWASRMVPRMRQRVVEPALGVGAPRWVTVADLDLDRHVHRVRLDPPGSVRQLLDLVGEFATAPLDRDRPLWRVLLVEGLADGQAGYAVTTHHSTTDGLGAVQLMSLLHSRSPEHDPARPEPPVPAPDVGVSGVEVLTEQLAGTVRSAPLAALRRGVDAVGGLLRPWELAGQAVELARSAAHVLTPPRGGSPLLAARGGGWHLEVLEVPLADLKAGAKAAGGSLNDGLLAAVVGGFRRYSERMGAEPGTLTLGIPISLRAKDDPQGGNRFTGARFTADLTETDPAARIRTVREFVLSVRASGGAGAAEELLTPVLGWLPAPVIGALSGSLTSTNDVQVSNVPGVREPVWIAGSRITRMYPFGPLPGCAAMITLLSQEDRCCIGANLDRAAVTDPAGLVADLQAGLDEVVALGKA